VVVRYLRYIDNAVAELLLLSRQTRQVNAKVGDCTAALETGVDKRLPVV
jgi:hypothetical protein